MVGLSEIVFLSEPRLVDVTGRMRSPAATPGHWAGCAPPNKGQRYPADPPTVEEIILVMRQAGSGRYADRTRALIAILWRAGLRISEALALTESDLEPKSGSVLVRVGKGGICRKQHMSPYVAPGTMLRLVLELERGSGCGVLRARHGEGGDSGRRVLNATYFGGCHRDDRTGSSAPSRSTRPTNLSASASK
jgi:integrase